MAVKLNTADLQFILRQIKISEANSEAHTGGLPTPLTEIYVDAAGNVVPSTDPGAVLAIPEPLVPNGLRTVDGTYNNLVAGRETWGAADQAIVLWQIANVPAQIDLDRLGHIHTVKQPKALRWGVKPAKHLKQ